VTSSPLEARIERTATGCTIRAPVRREEVLVEKRTIVGERVVIRRFANEVGRGEGSVRREKPRTDPGNLEATQPMVTPPHHDTLAGTGMDQEPLS
jgi:stress response protein YsnF